MTDNYVACLLVAVVAGFHLSNVYAEKPHATIFAAGDIARCRDLKVGPGAVETAQLLDKLVADNPGALVLGLGDLAYQRGSKQEFESCYEPTWGRHKNRTLPVPGNHEFGPSDDFSKSFNIKPYNEYWASRFASFLPHTGNPQEGYYGVDVGEWRLLGVNTELIVNNSKMYEPYLRKQYEGIEDRARREELLNKLDEGMSEVDRTYPVMLERQNKWLEEEAFPKDKKCTLAFMHHPRYSSGHHGNTPRETEPLEPLYNLLNEHNVSVVLTGHDHQYERFYPLDEEDQRNFEHGIRTFVVGSGGAEPRKFASIHKNSEVRNNEDWGVLKLELFEDSYSWQFIPTSGEPGEKYTEACVPRS